MSIPPELDIRLRGPETPSLASVLTPEALHFVHALTLKFRPRVLELLEARKTPVVDFPPQTRHLRDGEWTVAPLPEWLMDRRVEITGPVDRKMVINALNSGARVFMADFEDATAPTWANVIEGQQNLADAVRGTIAFTNAAGREYRLNPQTAELFVRPRGWHLWEEHLEIGGQPVPAGLFDVGLFLFHNGQALLDKGRLPCFYLPKLEHSREARLWNDVFVFAQETLGLPHGSCKATVLIETLPAVFQIDDILFELRDHSAGVNCGRWDYLFSLIKVLNPPHALPDRGRIGMTQPCMRAYANLAVAVAHRRGAHAMGGMAAHIPNKRDLDANARALDAVRKDKWREAADGHDGTWVAHPGLVSIAYEAMTRPHQMDRRPKPVYDRALLTRLPHGAPTAEGIHTNLSVCLRYLAAWLRGQGCVPIDGLMEDAATAEISRAQLWHWRSLGHVTEDALRQQLSDLITDVELGAAADVLLPQLLAPTLPPFLTLAAYDRLKELS